MGQSLAAKFQNNQDEVLAYTRMYGQMQACERFQVSYLAFHDWLKKVTGDENYGLGPQVGRQTGENLDSQLVQRFADYVIKTKALLDAKDERIVLLESRLKTYEKRNYDMALPVLKMMEAVQA